MGKKLDKFLLLMWKNWTLQYRRPIQTSVEILAPVLFSILLVVLRGLVEPTENPEQDYFPFHPVPLRLFGFNFSNESAKLNASSYLQNYSLVYSPSPNAVLDRSMDILRVVFHNVKGYKNSEQLEAHFLSKEASKTYAALQFDNELYGKDDLPLKLEVSLRFPGELRSVGGHIFGQSNEGETTLSKDTKESVIDKLNRLFHISDWKTNLLHPVFQTPGPRDARRHTGAAPSYFLEGFLTLQVITTYILAFGQMGITSIEAIPNRLMENYPPILHMRRFPHAKWKEDPLLPALISFIGILIMLSFVYTCINTVKVITTEKEKQLKEAMKIMGLPNWLHWTAWFIKSLTFLLISIILIIILVKVTWYSQSHYSIFTYADPTVMFLFLLLYICATITFCFSISVFFSKANTASTVAGLLWFLSYAPYLFLQQQYDQLSLSTKLIASLGSNTAMAYGFQLFLMFETSNEGIQWSNIWEPNSPDDNLNLGLIMVMLTIDALIYLLIALYVEAVYPGEYGMPQPWYFPVTYTYWWGHPKHLVVEDCGDNSVNKSEFFEKNPSDLKAGIQIINLCKTFGRKTAVKNLYLNIYDDQITVLLGHNGAGKTTTMSMLTGIIPPTSGTAIVRNYDIRTSLEDARANLGLCPQHNILFDELTVKEHLYFFSKLKGLKKSEINREIDKYVNLLELQSKMNKKSLTLSGGMKRKLCVGIALCGNSTVVLLDEPTAGMDPTARRALWGLLQEQKQGRSILLTTHYMDEADLLGDRVAIMAGGELQCCGSSFFLKKKYGAGYHLILDKSPECKPSEVTELLKEFVPDIQVHGNAGSELTYLLSEDQVTVFEDMLRKLEQNTQQLGIRSYGISLTTLEEVFMKVGAAQSQEKAYDVESLEKTTKSKVTDLQAKMTAKKIELLSGHELILNQFIAMLMKKFLSIVRTWILQFIQVLIPVAFLIIAIVVSRNMKRTGDLPKLRITLDSYNDPITLVEDRTHNNFSRLYFEVLKGHKVEKVSSITETMLELTEKIPATVRKRYLVGASFEYGMSNITMIMAWFNSNPYHTAPLALALVLQVVYKDLMTEDHEINFANYPLPFTPNTKVDRLLKGNSMGFQLAFNLGFSMAFVSSFYILFYVKENVCKSKHLQFASGVKAYIFWITAFLCDLMTFIVTIIAILITLLCFQEEGFRSVTELGRMFLLLFYFGFAMLPMMYIASYWFDIPSTGYTRMTLFSVITGVTAFLIVQILSTPGLSLKDTADALHWGLLPVPHYSLATGIRDTYVTFATTKMCAFFVHACVDNKPNMTIDDCWQLACSNYSEALTHYCCVRNQDYYRWESPGIGRNLLYSFLFGLILFLLLILMEYKVFSKITLKFIGKYRHKVPQRNLDEDSEVLEERQKIQNNPLTQLQRDYIIILKDMTKYYKSFLAVNGLCLGIKQFECFGLLGVNGAGKTTTFKMITGDIKITYGEAWIGSFSIKTQLEDVQKLIGYCPQFDALLPDLTAKETLTMFALLRGIPFRDCTYVLEKLAQDFDFFVHLNKKVKQLSGGNKRKLSTAISLIGDPPVICLDEPTAGMDPATKRNLWNALCTIRDSGKCILFTSHSMEECEALCTRLVIMVNGNFKCLGSIQHLKNKFAAGYALTIKIKRTPGSGDLDYDTGLVEEFVAENFPNAVQQEKHQELLTYYIPDTNDTWSNMFGVLEKAKGELNIEDYSLGQSSLEQIFLAMTKLQR